MAPTGVLLNPPNMFQKRSRSIMMRTRRQRCLINIQFMSCHLHSRLLRMARIGRSRKVGLRRINAAYDALIPLGFSKEQVRKTIRNLLKVYGGDAGWVFIEEACYKLVIDTLLQQQEDGGTENMEALPATEHVSDAVGETSLIPAITSDNQDTDEFSSSDQHGDTRLMQRMHAVDIESSSTKKLSEESASSVTIESSYDQQPIGQPARKRPRFYGCISETESDSEDEF